jgi:MarR family transcriptional regulator, organic hydroperoxide resistance regulator
MPKKRPDPLHLSEQLCFSLYSAVHALQRTYRSLLEDLGLTYPQYLVMLVLWEEEGLTVKTLGDRLHLDSGTLTPLLKRLEASGLVVRTRDPQDERQVRIGLTPQGRAMRTQAEGIPRALVEASGCTLAEMQTLKGELNRFRDALNARLESE